MISVKYHICYWSVPAIAAALYRGLVSTLGCPEAAFQTLLIPLGIYAFCVNWAGPYRRSWPSLHLLATGGLLVSLGAATGYFHVPGHDVKQIEGAIHTLLAFATLGALEPIRQNVRRLSALITSHLSVRYPINTIQRQDIEPCLAFSILMGPRKKLPLLSYACLLRQGYSLVFCLALNLAIMIVINRGLSRSYGPGVSLWSIRNDQLLNLGDHFGSMLLELFILGPFADLTETISLSLYPILKRPPASNNHANSRYSFLSTGIDSRM